MHELNLVMSEFTIVNLSAELFKELDGYKTYKNYNKEKFKFLFLSRWIGP